MKTYLRVGMLAHETRSFIADRLVTEGCTLITAGNNSYMFRHKSVFLWSHPKISKKIYILAARVTSTLLPRMPPLIFSFTGMRALPMHCGCQKIVLLLMPVSLSRYTYRSFSGKNMKHKGEKMKHINRSIAIFFSMMTLVISHSGTGTAQPAIIPKPLSMQVEKGSLTLPRVLRVSAPAGYELTPFLNSEGATGTEYKAVTSSDPSGEIKILLAAGNKNPESYTLSIKSQGIEITAPGYAGCLYAVETLKQILAQGWTGKEFELPCLTIKDEPAFPYRGFMLDPSRHFQPVATVKHVLDYMLSMKLNIFHWHLSDDQGWRVQSLKYPELNLRGSFMIDTDKVETNGFYTIAEIHDIIKYAADRNIKVIPEFDVPGHSLAVLTSLPGLTCPWKPGSNAFCAGNPRSAEVIKELFSELIDIFKPEYIHVGGDERPKDLWNKCDLCLAKMKETGVTNENDLQSKMLIEISEFIQGKGVKTITWAENLEGGLADGQIVQSWRLRNEAFKSIKMGHQVINSDNGETYLDYPENAVEAKSKPSWMAVLPVEKVYNFNIIPKGLTKEEEKMVIGSECPLWTELITIDKIYPQISRRLEAHAEKCWTPAAMKNFADFTARLNRLSDYFKLQFYGETKRM